MNVIFFLADIQDTWLFNYFLKPGHKIICAKSNKITSPHRFQTQLQEKGYNVVLFDGCDSATFKQELQACDFFVTKECLPFYGEHEFANKVISICWTAESGNKTSRHHINIEGGYKYHYSEKMFEPLYEKLGYKNIIYSNPKYYFLNNLSRDKACKILNLPPEEKYVTIFSGQFTTGDSGSFKMDDRAFEYVKFIEKLCKENNCKILLKNKMKYGDYLKGSINHFKFFAGNNLLYHQGIALQSISEFCVGFSTSASTEAHVMGSRFISFWNQEIQEFDDLCEDIVQKSGEYRLALGKNIMNIHPSQKLSDKRDELQKFINESRRGNYKNKFEIDNFLKTIFN